MSLITLILIINSIGINLSSIFFTFDFFILKTATEIVIEIKKLLEYKVNSLFLYYATSLPLCVVDINIKMHLFLLIYSLILILTCYNIIKYLNKPSSNIINKNTWKNFYFKLIKLSLVGLIAFLLKTFLKIKYDTDVFLDYTSMVSLAYYLFMAIFVSLINNGFICKKRKTEYKSYIFKIILGTCIVFFIGLCLRHSLAYLKDTCLYDALLTLIIIFISFLLREIIVPFSGICNIIMDLCNIIFSDNKMVINGSLPGEKKSYFKKQDALNSGVNLMNNAPNTQGGQPGGGGQGGQPNNPMSLSNILNPPVNPTPAVVATTGVNPTPAVVPTAAVNPTPAAQSANTQPGQDFHSFFAPYNRNRVVTVRDITGVATRGYDPNSINQPYANNLADALQHSYDTRRYSNVTEYKLLRYRWSSEARNFCRDFVWHQYGINYNKKGVVVTQDVINRLRNIH